MTRYTKIPALTGIQLIKLLQKGGWVPKRYARHGVALAKKTGDRTKVTVIPHTRATLDEGTLQAILGPKQTGIGKKGLLDLVNKFGV